MFPRSLPIPAGRRDEATRPMVPLFPDRPKISRFALGLGLHSVMCEKGVGCQTIDRRGCRSLGYSGRLNFILFLLMWQPASQPHAPSGFDITVFVWLAQAPRVLPLFAYLNILGGIHLTTPIKP